MLVEIPAYDVICMKDKGLSPEAIPGRISEIYDLPLDEAQRFVNEVIQIVNQSSEGNSKVPGTGAYESPEYVPVRFYSKRNYQINGLIYAVEYETAQLEHLIHPKFAHLERNINIEADHFYQLFYTGDRSVLRVNGVTVGQWPPGEEHYLSGKFSMELVNRMYGKTESDWMGVFHASAISHENKSILFLGDSGSGKSTICAVLMAHGFQLLADDFVPVDGATGAACYFPAAVSVKKNALAPLIGLFPQLCSAAEFNFPAMDKTVRYLPPTADNLARYSCKALVFVRYQKKSGCKLEKMSMDTAFQQIVPDSWISPLEENAARFLDWFLELPCYRLTYSNNSRMVASIEKIFRNDL